MKLAYLFIDLDETLVYSAAATPAETQTSRFRWCSHGGYLTLLRPEAHALLGACREEAKEVIL